LAKKDCGRQKSSAASSGKTVDIDVYNPMYREIKERYAASQQSCSTDHSKMASEFVTSSAQVGSHLVTKLGSYNIIQSTCYFTVEYSRGFTVH